VKKLLENENVEKEKEKERKCEELDKNSERKTNRSLFIM